MSRVNPILPRHDFLKHIFYFIFLRTSFTRCFQNLLFSSFSSPLTLHEISLDFILNTQNIVKLMKNSCSLSIFSRFSRHFKLSTYSLELLRIKKFCFLEMTYFALYIVSVTQLPIISRTIVLNDPLQLLKLQPGKKMLFDTHKHFFS